MAELHPAGKYYVRLYPTRRWVAIASSEWSKVSLCSHCSSAASWTKNLGYSLRPS